ncbi:DNA-binding transcriptional regulator, MerR family [Propionibacterium cyclohexanicum]|uniref:DNA-binding transcriptional regulator, MerR family n=1 Tax=Propionibacterium cyclohexanicum TaxID=64702 RepID=A0A1H9TM65_9ACTN|nr:MerR family transcriptional regulator [Propionibacterium cyclohexanicum]SER98400.1 DNA-binding transcriptional regulator, MerR family [Propionibacterium cyclohexanicum]
MAEENTELTVAQMSAATGITAHTLRYYERAELIRPVARNSGNQRRYSPADVEWVKFLLRLRETGMPIAQMREYATLREHGPITTEPRLRLLEAHQVGLREQIARLRAHEKALAAKIATYRDDLAARHAHRRNEDDDD